MPKLSKKYPRSIQTYPKSIQKISKKFPKSNQKVLKINIPKVLQKYPKSIPHIFQCISKYAKSIPKNSKSIMKVLKSIKERKKERTKKYPNSIQKVSKKGSQKKVFKQCPKSSQILFKKFLYFLYRGRTIYLDFRPRPPPSVPYSIIYFIVALST